MKNKTEGEYYKGILVREGLNNIIALRIDKLQFISLIDESERTKLPIAEIIRLSSTPCSNCKNIQVVAYNSKDEFIQVKRGMICSSYKKQTSGATIINQKKKLNESPQ